MICAINAGSTSLKYKVFSKNLKEHSGQEFSDITVDGQVFSRIVGELSNKDVVHKIKIVVHRVVHGGPSYSKPTRITETVLQDLKNYNHLAPLHNPYNIRGIELARSVFHKAVHYAIFDTAFFASLPRRTRLYPIPLLYAEKHGIQRYGFHGISHGYAMQHASENLNKAKPSLITLHLGGGCSIAAIQNGKPIDTSMGYTPMEGLMMWSRAGDIDPGIILGKVHLSGVMLNSESGLKGISGCSNYLELLSKYRAKDDHAALALEMFIYRIQKYIGSYYAALKGNIDALAFTGAIGAGDPLTRKLVLSGLPFLKKVKMFVIPSNEEWMMASLVQKL